MPCSVVSALERHVFNYDRSYNFRSGRTSGEMLLILDFIVWQTETCVVVRVQRELFSERFLWTTSESKDQHWMELVFCGYKPYPQPHDLGQ